MLNVGIEPVMRAAAVGAAMASFDQQAAPVLQAQGYDTGPLKAHIHACMEDLMSTNTILPVQAVSLKDRAPPAGATNLTPSSFLGV